LNNQVSLMEDSALTYELSFLEVKPK
jgi:hypothetical protein